MQPLVAYPHNNLQFHSSALTLLAHTISSKLNSSSKTGVDFSSVIKMIDDMVALLKKEGAL
mgnify:CR=1 FL=1